VRETIAKLVDLQKADHRALELRRRKDEMDTGLSGARKGVDAAKVSLEAAHKVLLEAKSQVHRKEMDLKQREDQIRDVNAKLGTATSNKEYASLLLKIGELKIENGRTEEEILLAMDEVDAKEKLHEEARSKLRDAEAALHEAEAKISAQKAALDSDAAEVAALRTALASQVPSEALRIYERIRAGNKKSGTAVAVVHGEYCQGCQMSITSHELTELIQGLKIVICRTCQRILVLEA